VNIFRIAISSACSHCASHWSKVPHVISDA